MRARMLPGALRFHLMQPRDLEVALLPHARRSLNMLLRQKNRDTVFHLLARNFPDERMWDILPPASRDSGQHNQFFCEFRNVMFSGEFVDKLRNWMLSGEKTMPPSMPPSWAPMEVVVISDPSNPEVVIPKDFGLERLRAAREAGYVGTLPVKLLGAANRAEVMEKYWPAPHPSSGLPYGDRVYSGSEMLYLFVTRYMELRTHPKTSHDVVKEKVKNLFKAELGERLGKKSTVSKFVSQCLFVGHCCVMDPSFKEFFNFFIGEKKKVLS